MSQIVPTAKLDTALVAAAAEKIQVIRPQPKQEQFLKSPADIAVIGGAAGGGKSMACSIEPLRHKDNPGFRAVLFRRTTPQITNPGGNWDESMRWYPGTGAIPTESRLRWRWPSGARFQMTHLEREGDVENWKSTQLPLIIFEELTQFTEKQFWYMLSRNRSTCGIRPYIRASTNPDSDSWVRVLVDWYIGPDGFAIPERSGVLRYFTRLDDKLEWADSAEELVERIPDLEIINVKSFTFIASKLSDNQALMKADPGYLGNLMALDRVSRGQLLDGNWDIRPAAGMYFQREWVNIIEVFPNDITWCRAWDLAATLKTDSNDPDQTADILIGKCTKGKYYIAEANTLWGTPHQVRRKIRRTAEKDGYDVMIRLPQDPAQAGKSQAQDLVTDLDGFSVVAKPVTGDKVTRFSGFSSQAEGGNVYVLESTDASGALDEWYKQLEGFPEIKLKDLVDATSDGYDLLRRYSALIAV